MRTYKNIDIHWKINDRKSLTNLEGIVKYLLIFLLATQVMARHEGYEYECVGQGQKLVLTAVSDRIYHKTEKKCKKHSRIQFAWEAYSYYVANLNGKRLSGIACSEDVSFEFRSSNKYRGRKVAVKMYLDELDDATHTVGNRKYRLECELTKFPRN